MTLKQYQQLKEIIINANSDCNTLIVDMTSEQLEEIALDAGYFDSKKFIKKRPITLADILIALRKNWEDNIDKMPTGFYNDRLLKIVKMWCWENNSLDWHYEHQQGTVEFLYKLLK